MHIGIANPRWWGKLSRHLRRIRDPQFTVSGKRPILVVVHSSLISQIPQCIRLISHNAPWCNRIVYTYAHFSQNGSLWDTWMVHCGICATGLILHEDVTTWKRFPYDWSFENPPFIGSCNVFSPVSDPRCNGCRGRSTYRWPHTGGRPIQGP